MERLTMESEVTISGAVNLRDRLVAEVYYPLNMALVLSELPPDEYAVIARFVGRLTEARKKL